MSIKHFNNISDEEAALLIKAPALVTVLIAGADENIEKKEREWAAKLVHYRTFTSDPRLQDYYELVKARFETYVNDLTDNWTPGSAAVTEELAGVKDILAKLDDEYADLLRESWKSLAKKVAEASGGLLGFGSIDEAEMKLISLPMI